MNKYYTNEMRKELMTKRIRAHALFIILVLLIAQIPVVFAHENVDFEWMIGTGFLEEFGKVVAMAPNGDTIELIGNGTFSTKPKRITGGGTVIHSDKNGTVIGTGRWYTKRLISFKSYGSGIEQGLPENFEGGRALVKVWIQPDGTNQSFEGTLWITCTLGDKIPRKAAEGVRLAVRAIPINFNKEVSGATLFIRKDIHEEDG